MSRLVSIIVPCYKSEKYLNRCITSLVTQQYSAIEVILVDDGSPDRCGEICEAWALKDSRIRVVHQNNSGASVSRNKGIETACGEYICFVDSDDWVDSDYVSALVDAIEMTKSDMAISGRMMLRIGGKEERYVPKNLYLKDEQIKELFIDPSFDYVRGGPCGKLYKSEVIRKCKLAFIPDIHYLEDAIFVMNYLLKCRSIVSIPNVSYNYELHEGSLVFTVHSFETESMGYWRFKELADLCAEKFRLQTQDRTWLNDNMLFMIHRQISAAKEQKNIAEQARSLNQIDWNFFKTATKSGSFKQMIYIKTLVNPIFRFLRIVMGLI